MSHKIFLISLIISTSTAYAEPPKSDNTPKIDAHEICECVDSIVSRTIEHSEIDVELAICTVLAEKKLKRYLKEPEKTEAFKTASIQCLEEKGLTDKINQELTAILHIPVDLPSQEAKPSTNDPAKDALLVCECMDEALKLPGQLWMAAMDQCVAIAEEWEKQYDTPEQKEQWNKAGEACVTEKGLEKKIEEKLQQ